MKFRLSIDLFSFSQSAFRSLMYVLLFYIITLNFNISQAQSRLEPWPISQFDSRVSVEIEYEKVRSLDFQIVKVYVTNQTSDTLCINLELTITGTSGDSKTYTIGTSKSRFDGLPSDMTASSLELIPRKRTGGDINNCLMQFYGKCSANTAIKVGENFSCIREISYKASLFNLSELRQEQAKKKAEEKAEKERIAKEKKEEDERKKREQEDKLAKKKALEDARIKKIEEERITNQKAEEARKNSNNTVSGQGENKAQTNNSYKNETSEGQITYTEKQKKEQADREEQYKQKIAEQEEAEKQRQKKVEDYNVWKTKATEAQNNADLAKATASLSVIAMFWDIIYGDMGKVNPNNVFIPPAHSERFRAAPFLGLKFGYSSTVAPILFRSKTSSIDYFGNPTNSDKAVGTNVLYLNIGGKMDFGVCSEFYSIYISPQITLGIMPTFHGTNYNAAISVGGDYGFRNAKIYSKLKYVDETRTYHNSNPEETGDGGKYDKGSREFEYGLKFTFGGGPQNDYVRHHLYLGMLTKHIDLGSSSYSNKYIYDGINNKYYNTGLYTMSGYSFEWKKDHFFSFYVHVYPKHPFLGSLETYNKLDNSTGTNVEIGFLRALDLFDKPFSKSDKASDFQEIKTETDTRTSVEKMRSNEFEYTNLGVISGKIAKYGIVMEHSGPKSIVGIRLAARSSLTKDNQITDDNGIENKQEFDIGPTFRVFKHLVFYLGIGVVDYKYLQNKNYYSFANNSIKNHECMENSIGAILRLGRVLNLSAGLSFMDLYKRLYTPEATFGLTMNLIKRAK